MKKVLASLMLAAVAAIATVPASAQFNLKKAVGGATKAAQALTLTDEQMRQYVKEYIDWMDTHNKVCDAESPYTQRLNRLTEGLTDVEGIPLNFKVYYVIDVNAFACADGSVRVFSSLMDIMTDEELLGVIGHEIGHVAHKDSKKAFRTALLTSALKDGISAKGGVAAALTESQLGDLSEASFTISIHTPARGVTYIAAVLSGWLSISIHTPAQGVTYIAAVLSGWLSISIHTHAQGVTHLASNLCFF